MFEREQKTTGLKPEGKGKADTPAEKAADKFARDFLQEYGGGVMVITADSNAERKGCSPKSAMIALSCCPTTLAVGMTDIVKNLVASDSETREAALVGIMQGLAASDVITTKEGSDLLARSGVLSDEHQEVVEHLSNLIDALKGMQKKKGKPTASATREAA